MEIFNVKNGNYNADLFLTRLKEVSGHKYQKDIAADLFLNEPTLSKKITGETKWSCSELLQISRKYKCSIDYLLGLDVTKPAANEPEPPFKYPMFARAISNCFRSGIYVLDDTEMDDILMRFHNDVARYICKNIIMMYKILSDGAITQDVYDTWLDGLCNDFDYRVVSPASIKLELPNNISIFSVNDELHTTDAEILRNELTMTENTTVSFPSFATWVEMKPENDLSERDLYRHYASELELYGDVSGDVSLKFDDIGIALLKL